MFSKKWGSIGMNKGKKQIKINNIIICMGILISLAVSLIFSPSIKADAEIDKGLSNRIVGYLPYYQKECIDTLNYSALTHINLAFANPDAEGNLVIPMSDEDIKRVVSKAHENGTKVLISLGGFADSTNINYANLCVADQSIEKFSDKIMEFVDKHNLDGVDLDIEGNASDGFWNGYDEFSTILSNKCKNKGKLITTAVGKWYANKISDGAFRQFDYVMLMAYDYDSTNNAPMSFVNEMIDYFKGRGIPQNKLVIGVPFYGWREDWSGASYKDIIASDINARNSDYCQGLSYNGEATIRAKANLSKQYGGTMIWELGQDAQGEQSLLEIIKKELIDYSKIKYDNNSAKEGNSNTESPKNQNKPNNNQVADDSQNNKPNNSEINTSSNINNVTQNENSNQKTGSSIENKNQIDEEVQASNTGDKDGLVTIFGFIISAIFIATLNRNKEHSRKSLLQ